MNPFWRLVAEKTMTHILVDKGEDDGVGRSDSVETSTRGEGQENARSEDEEEKSSCQKISPHLVCLRLGKNYANSMRQGPSVRVPPGQGFIDLHCPWKVSFENTLLGPPALPGTHLSIPETHPTPGQ
jgi:hypothetical protein